MITIQRQPNGSKTCGQHVVAMLADVPVSETIKVYGHSHATSTKEHRAALKHFGFETAPRFKRYRYKKDLPKLCIIRMKHLIGKGSHVAIYHNGFIYCSELGVWKYNKEYFEAIRCRPVSYLEVYKLLFKNERNEAA